MEKSKDVQYVEDMLGKIGYTLRHHGAGFFYIYDHEGNHLPWYVRNGRISYESPVSFRMACDFYLKDCTITVDEESFTLAPKDTPTGSPFLSLYHFQHTNK